jgi:hypothetical protein
MKEYLEHTYNIINTSLDRYFYVKKNKLNSEQDEFSNKLTDQAQRQLKILSNKGTFIYYLLN